MVNQVKKIYKVIFIHKNNVLSISRHQNINKILLSLKYFYGNLTLIKYIRIY